ncbi:MAG: hypothetical protein ACI81P_002831 [Neolewinella sp.]
MDSIFKNNLASSRRESWGNLAEVIQDHNFMNAIRFNFQFDVQKMAQELRDLTAYFETIYSRSTQDNMLQGIHLITSVAGGRWQTNG